MSQSLIVCAALSADKLKAQLAPSAGRAGFNIEIAGHIPAVNAYLVRIDTPDVGRARDYRRMLLGDGHVVAADRKLIPPRTTYHRQQPIRRWRLRAGPRSLRSSGVAIGVLDADGVIDHPTFGGRLERYVLENDAMVIGAHQVSGPEGSAVASVAAGGVPIASPAPNARVLAYQTPSVWAMMKAIEHFMTTANGCVLVTAWEIQPKEPGEEDGFEALVQKARDQGIVMLAAAGNDGPKEGTLSGPAKVPAIVAVGGFRDGEDLTPVGFKRADPTDLVHEQSARGTAGAQPAKPDFLQFFGSHEVLLRNGKRGAASGTSMAVARAAGVVATWYSQYGGRQSATVPTGMTAAELADLFDQQAGWVALHDKSTNKLYDPHEQGRGAMNEDEFAKLVKARRP
ncbi:MAG: S8 family serine peptidase [Polyangiaceae bacterium]|nr:S8 family serine peptidase [Polyangiaceae bacterium]